MDEIKILKQDVMPVHALPVFKEETNFVLTKDELDIVLNQDYHTTKQSGKNGVKISKSDTVLEDEKLQRVKTLLLNDRQSAVKDEPLEDAYLDVSNYGIMATIVGRGKWGK